MFTTVTRSKKIGFIAISLVFSILTGCASNGKSDTDTESAYYESAQEQLENRNYSMAIERLSELQSRFPFGSYSKASLLDLMYAQFASKDFTSSLIEADRFTRLNPDHPNVDYAWFIQAMSYYELYLTNRGIFGNGDAAKRSPEQGQKAFNSLSIYTARFPNSEYRQEALKAMVVVKDSLARHELIVADYYIRRGAWVAASERAQVVVAHYPGVSAVGDALVVLVESYKALNLTQEHNLALEKLRTDYPNHAVFASGEYKAPKWQEDRWWVKLITLGLTS